MSLLSGSVVDDLDDFYSTNWIHFCSNNPERGLIGPWVAILWFRTA